MEFEVDLAAQQRNFHSGRESGRRASDESGEDGTDRQRGSGAGAEAADRSGRTGEACETWQKLAVITSDITRPLPSKDVLPAVLARLAKAGSRRIPLRLYSSLGSHRPHKDAEKEHLVARTSCAIMTAWIPARKPTCIWGLLPGNAGGYRRTGGSRGFPGLHSAILNIITSQLFGRREGSDGPRVELRCDPGESQRMTEKAPSAGNWTAIRCGKKSKRRCGSARSTTL